MARRGKEVVVYSPFPTGMMPYAPQPGPEFFGGSAPRPRRGMSRGLAALTAVVVAGATIGGLHFGKEKIANSKLCTDKVPGCADVFHATTLPDVIESKAVFPRAGNAASQPVEKLAQYAIVAAINLPHCKKENIDAKTKKCTKPEAGAGDIGIIVDIKVDPTSFAEVVGTKIDPKTKKPVVTQDPSLLTAGKYALTVLRSASVPAEVQTGAQIADNRKEQCLSDARAIVHEAQTHAAGLVTMSNRSGRFPFTPDDIRGADSIYDLPPYTTDSDNQGAPNIAVLYTYGVDAKNQEVHVPLNSAKILTTVLNCNTQS